MALTLTGEERRALEAAQAKSRAVRHWRRYQAVLLRADGLAVAEVARVLRCTETSVCNWTAAWRAGGGGRGAGGGHPGQGPRPAPPAGRALEAPKFRPGTPGSALHEEKRPSRRRRRPARGGGGRGGWARRGGGASPRHCGRHGRDAANSKSSYSPDATPAAWSMGR